MLRVKRYKDLLTPTSTARTVSEQSLFIYLISLTIVNVKNSRFGFVFHDRFSFCREWACSTDRKSTK